jgi:trigger factor
MEIPDAMIETQVETMIDEFAQRITQQGLSFEQYMQFSGVTIDKMKEQVRPDAVSRIKSSLVLEKIAEEEKIEATEEDINAEIQRIADAYGMETDKITEIMGDAERESMKKDLAVQKAVEFVMDNVKERAKPKRKENNQ